MKMFRRRFLQLVTMASVGGLAPLQGVAAEAGRTVTYFVKGFSCITCATGLDTMLGQQKGIVSSRSTYPEGKVIVGFDPRRTNEQAIVAFITDLGFTVQVQPHS
jgi:copper chaperone CopZ